MLSLWSTCRQARTQAPLCNVSLVQESSITDEVEAVTRDKRREIEAGVDGFLIYDLALAAPCRQLWADMEKTRQNLNSKKKNS